MMILEFDKNKPGFAVRDGDCRFSFEFISAPLDSCISVQEETASYWVRNGVRALIFADGSGVVLLFSREFLFPCTFGLRLEGVDAIKEHSFVVNDIEYRVEVQDGDYRLRDGVVTMPETMMRIDIVPAALEGAVSAQAINPDASVIGPVSRPPEFSIGIFDDANFTVPRQLRNGVPVVSTLPTIANTATNALLLDKGEPENQRTMHFRIICNKILETGLVSGDLSKLKLKIYMPTGLDTVSAKPVIVGMYYVGTNDTQSVYRASYVFNKEDTEKYVDGFFYLSVYAPVIIRRSLPLKFEA